MPPQTLLPLQLMFECERRDLVVFLNIWLPKHCSGLVGGQKNPLAMCAVRTRQRKSEELPDVNALGNGEYDYS